LTLLSRKKSNGIGRLSETHLRGGQTTIVDCAERERERERERKTMRGALPEGDEPKWGEQLLLRFIGRQRCGGEWTRIEHGTTRTV
jgi:hypothetical protein